MRQVGTSDCGEFDRKDESGATSSGELESVRSISLLLRELAILTHMYRLCQGDLFPHHSRRRESSSRKIATVPSASPDMGACRFEPITTQMGLLILTALAFTAPTADSG